MMFMIEVRPVGTGPAMCGICDVVDGDVLFERGYEPVLGLMVRSLAAQTELALAEQAWGDHDA